MDTTKKHSTLGTKYTRIKCKNKLYITSAKDRNQGPANNYDTANVTGLVSLVYDICKQRQSKKVWLYMIVRHRFF